MTQIAGDGGLLEAPVTRNAVPLGPAERVDVVVDFRRFRAGAQVQLTNTLGSGRHGDGDAVRRDRRRRDSGRLPSRLRPREEIPRRPRRAAGS